MFRKIVFVLVLTFVLGFVKAQNLNTSPYTRFGIGEINSISTAHYRAMGNIGVSFADFTYINVSNPASYSSFKKNNTLFDLGVTTKVSSYKAVIDDVENSSSGTNAALNNMLIGLPISKKTGLVLGIMPFSTIGFDITSTDTDLIVGDTVSYNYSGDGSVNRILLGIGHDFLNKGDTTRFSLGLNSSYLFGTIDRNNSVIFQTSSFYNSRVQNRISLSGFSFDAGLHYYQQISGASENDKWYWQFGATQRFSSNINAKRDYYAYTFTYNFSVQEIAKDTLEFFEDESGTISIPDRFSIGFNIGRNKQNKNVWALGAQFSVYNWNLYQESFANVSSDYQQLSQMTELSIGGRITPTFDFANKNKNVFQKSTYSLGSKFGNTFININEEQLVNYGMNFGISLPLLSSRSLSRINLAVELGKLGTTQNGLIEDNYFKCLLGFSLAPDAKYDRWFRKRKYD